MKTKNTIKIHPSSNIHHVHICNVHHWTSSSTWTESHHFLRQGTWSVKEFDIWASRIFEKAENYCKLCWTHPHKNKIKLSDASGSSDCFFQENISEDPGLYILSILKRTQLPTQNFTYFMNALRTHLLLLLCQNLWTHCSCVMDDLAMGILFYETFIGKMVVPLGWYL